MAILVLGETAYMYTLTLDREPMADQSMNTTKVRFGEPLGFIKVTFRFRNDSKISASQISPQHGCYLAKGTFHSLQAR